MKRVFFILCPIPAIFLIVIWGLLILWSMGIPNDGGGYGIGRLVLFFALLALGGISSVALTVIGLFGWMASGREGRTSMIIATVLSAFPGICLLGTYFTLSIWRE